MELHYYSIFFEVKLWSEEKKQLVRTMYALISF